MNKIKKICVIKGDGIGPEVIEEAIRLLKSMNLKFRFYFGVAGLGAFERFGVSVPLETLRLCKMCDAILAGPCTTPPLVKGYQSAHLTLRKELDLYANWRPIFSIPLKKQRYENINLEIVRENVEGLYSGREKRIRGGAIAERVITRKNSKRIIEFAFQLAKMQGRKKVTVVHKANILRLTDGLFLSIAREISKRYPNISLEEMHVDACAAKMVQKPQDFEVIVTTNLFGDILSDLGAGLVGGLGLAPSANVGAKNVLFSPVHGSAPDIAGKGIANPLATFFSLEMMLKFFHLESAAKRLRRAIFKSIEKNVITPDLGGKATTREVTDRIIRLLKT